VTDNYGTIGGGGNNQAGDADAFPSVAIYATVGGGTSNTASSAYSTVGGGEQNTASGWHGSVGGGYLNSASGVGGTVAGGKENTASGGSSMVPGGYLNTAAGDYSLAAGCSAQASHNGAFVWADSTGASFVSQRADQFRVRAGGGARFDDGGEWVDIRDVDGLTDLITTSTGAHLTIGGAWTDSSARAGKENFAVVDGREVLDKVSVLPISTWNYKAEGDSVRHLGPVAEDFSAVFGLGRDVKHIASLDTGGVALAAIQGLHEVVKEKDAEIAKQCEEIDELRARLTTLEALVAKLAGE
jgi:hypothetical protein